MRVLLYSDFCYGEATASGHHAVSEQAAQQPNKAGIAKKANQVAADQWQRVFEHRPPGPHGKYQRISYKKVDEQIEHRSHQAARSLLYFIVYVYSF